jgi:hypothetical protein
MSGENRPLPLTEKELKEKLRNIQPEQIVPAESTQVERHELTLDRILRAMGEIADCDWRFDTVFISDLSSVGDFLREDAELAVLAEKLGLQQIGSDETLVDLALRLEPKQ